MRDSSCKAVPRGRPADRTNRCGLNLRSLSYKCDAGLFLDLNRCRRLRRQLQHGRFLALAQFSQEHGLAVRELESIVVTVRNILVDLTEYRRLVHGLLRSPAQQPVGNA